MTATKPPQLFIDGEFRTAEKCEPVLEAATGELLGDGGSATEADIDAAVAAAREHRPIRGFATGQKAGSPFWICNV